MHKDKYIFSFNKFFIGVTACEELGQYLLYYFFMPKMRIRSFLLASLGEVCNGFHFSLTDTLFLVSIIIVTFIIMCVCWYVCVYV